jgi:hypothetical protein
MKSHLLILLMFLLLCACEGGSSTDKAAVPVVEKSESPVVSDNLAIQDNRSLDTYQLLIIGNSHVQSIQKLLTIIFQEGAKEKIVGIDTRVGAFLDVIVDKESLIEIVETRPWTHIVLQGQKYSQSQTISYSTEETKTWIQRAKKIKATPILFPEHPQRGNAQEADYVHSIHKGIAHDELSCVAPIGLSWNKVLAVEPELALYQADGNHATELGALISALALYQVISGQSADLLPYIPELPGTKVTQALLGQLVSETIAGSPACDF